MVRYNSIRIRDEMIEDEYKMDDLIITIYNGRDTWIVVSERWLVNTEKVHVHFLVFLAKYYWIHHRNY